MRKEDLECYVEATLTDINDMQIFVDTKDNVSKEDVKQFLDELRLRFNEMLGEI